MSAAWLAGNAELAGVGVQVASKAEFFANADAMCAAPNDAVILKSSDTIVNVIGAVNSASICPKGLTPEAYNNQMDSIYKKVRKDTKRKRRRKTLKNVTIASYYGMDENLIKTFI